MQDLSLPDEPVAISAAMRVVLARVHTLAAADDPVLLLGERGVGKETVARLLHRLSARADQPFITVDGTAPPAESEWLSPSREAVLLVKEPAALAPALQDALAAALGVEPVQAGTAEPPAGLRVLAMSSDPAGARAPQLRPALAARLAARQLSLPPLRERLADIVPLAEHLLQLAAGDAPPKTLAPGAALRLLQHDWPGNVDELRETLDTCQAGLRHAVIGAHDLALGNASVAPADWSVDWVEMPLPAATERLERTLIVHALSATSGNRAEAARRLGIHRQLLYRKLALYGLA